MQTTTTNFDKLVKELSHGERREMMDKLKSSLSVSDEPLLLDDELPEEVDAEKVYAMLGLWRKFLLFLQTIFSGTGRQEVLEQLLLRRLGRSVEHRASGIVDITRERLLPAFHQDLTGLKEAADFLQPFLVRALGKDRQEFIAFLTGIELPEIQDRILRETDPEQAFSSGLQQSEAEMRRELLYRLETSLSQISEKERAILYQDIRLLHHLMALCRVPFGKLLGCFHLSEDAQPLPCALRDPKDHLVELENVLAGMRVPPTAQLLEALFLFTRPEKGKEPDEEMEERIRNQIRSAEDLFQKIRQFNRKIPLRDLIRYIRRDLNWLPAQSGGGEDWFVLYRQFWQQRIETRLHGYVTSLRIEDLERQAEEYIGEEGTSVSLRFYRDEELGAGIRAKFRRSLGFLFRFSRTVFVPAMNRHLKVLLMEGEFYKKENRTEFTDSYNGLLSLEGNIQRLEERFSSGGDIGTALVQIRKEIIPPAVRQKKIQAVISGGDREAERICSRAFEHMRILKDVLEGILYGQVGGHFDTLANFSSIGGKGNAAFLKNLDTVMRKLEEAARILGEIYEVEFHA